MEQHRHNVDDGHECIVPG